jgi:hypothetical protein
MGDNRRRLGGTCPCRYGTAAAAGSRSAGIATAVASDAVADADDDRHGGADVAPRFSQAEQPTSPVAGACAPVRATLKLVLLHRVPALATDATAPGVGRTGPCPGGKPCPPTEAEGAAPGFAVAGVAVRSARIVIGVGASGRAGPSSGREGRVVGAWYPKLSSGWGMSIGRANVLSSFTPRAPLRPLICTGASESSKDQHHGYHHCRHNAEGLLVQWCVVTQQTCCVCAADQCFHLHLAHATKVATHWHEH